MIAKGSITSEALVYSCLERIDLREPDVQAWAYLDPDLALAQARACDQIAPIGPLHGIPIGVKDIIETFANGRVREGIWKDGKFQGSKLGHSPGSKSKLTDCCPWCGVRHQCPRRHTQWRTAATTPSPPGLTLDAIGL